MRRVLTIIALFAAAPAYAQAPTLRSETTVRGEIVVIGDLVDNAGLAADVPIFRAPDLGQSGTVSARMVADAVRKHGVILSNSGPSEVLVTHQSRVVPTADFEAAVATAVANQLGMSRPRDIKVTFDRAPDPVHIETQASSRPRVARLIYDAQSGRFDATFEMPGSASARRMSIRLSGDAAETVEAVVVSRAVNRGETLRNADITIERRPRAEFGDDGFSSADSALGMAARRQLRAGQVLRQADLMKPEIVGRNDTVTLIFATRAVTVATRGRAITAGIEGDTVSVANLQSKRVVQGVVTGPGEVTVSTGALTGQVANADPVTTGSIRSGAARPNAVRTETIRPNSPSSLAR